MVEKFRKRSQTTTKFIDDYNSQNTGYHIWWSENKSKWRAHAMRIKTQKSTASSLSLKYRNHMFIPDEHDKVRLNFEDKNDWLRELVEKNLVNYLMTEISKSKIYLLKPLADVKQNKYGRNYSIIAFFLELHWVVNALKNNKVSHGKQLLRSLHNPQFCCHAIKFVEHFPPLILDEIMQSLNHPRFINNLHKE